MSGFGSVANCRLWLAAYSSQVVSMSCRALREGVSSQLSSLYPKIPWYLPSIQQPVLFCFKMESRSDSTLSDLISWDSPGGKVVQNCKVIESADSKRAAPNTIGNTVPAKLEKESSQSLVRCFARRGDVHVNPSLCSFFAVSSCRLSFADNCSLDWSSVFLMPGIFHKSRS